jgi:hypothetical protein
MNKIDEDWDKRCKDIDDFTTDVHRFVSDGLGAIHGGITQEEIDLICDHINTDLGSARYTMWFNGLLDGFDADARKKYYTLFYENAP